MPESLKSQVCTIFFISLLPKDDQSHSIPMRRAGWELVEKEKKEQNEVTLNLIVQKKLLLTT